MENTVINFAEAVVASEPSSLIHLSLSLMTDGGKSFAARDFIRGISSLPKQTALELLSVCQPTNIIHLA